MRLSNLFEDNEVREAVENAQLRAYEKLSSLTPRQRDVAVLMSEGYPNKVIAYRLGLSTRTVENHRVEILQKTEVKSLANLVRLVLLAG